MFQPNLINFIKFTLMLFFLVSMFCLCYSFSFSLLLFVFCVFVVYFCKSLHNLMLQLEIYLCVYV